MGRYKPYPLLTQIPIMVVYYICVSPNDCLLKTLTFFSDLSSENISLDKTQQMLYNVFRVWWHR